MRTERIALAPDWLQGRPGPRACAIGTSESTVSDVAPPRDALRDATGRIYDARTASARPCCRYARRHALCVLDGFEAQAALPRVWMGLWRWAQPHQGGRWSGVLATGSKARFLAYVFRTAQRVQGRALCAAECDAPECSCCAACVEPTCTKQVGGGVTAGMETTRCSAALEFDASYEQLVAARTIRLSGDQRPHQSVGGGGGR